MPTEYLLWGIIMIKNKLNVKCYGVTAQETDTEFFHVQLERKRRSVKYSKKLEKL